MSRHDMERERVTFWSFSRCDDCIGKPWQKDHISSFVYRPGKTKKQPPDTPPDWWLWQGCCFRRFATFHVRFPLNGASILTWGITPKSDEPRHRSSCSQITHGCEEAINAVGITAIVPPLQGQDLPAQDPVIVSYCYCVHIRMTSVLYSISLT